MKLALLSVSCTALIFSGCSQIASDSGGKQDNNVDDVTPSFEVLKADTVLTRASNCEVVNRRGDLWIRYIPGGKLVHEFRFGAGGSIAELRLGGSNVLAPSARGEITDRVIHSVMYREHVMMERADVPASDVAAIDKIDGRGRADLRFNVNQGGTDSGKDTNSTTRKGLPMILSVRVIPNACQVQIVSTARDQFHPQLNSFFKTHRNLFSEYRLESTGEIWVRKIEYYGGIYWDPRAPRAGDTGMWLEEWTPFSTSFRNAVFSIKAGGGAGEYYNFAQGRDRMVDAGAGYAVAAVNTSAKSKGVGIVVGRRQVEVNGAQRGSWRERILAYNAGGGCSCLDPLTNYDGTEGILEPGSLTDRMYYIVPMARDALSDASRQRLEGLVPRLLPMRVFERARGLPSDFGYVIDMLRVADGLGDNDDARRTSHLGQIAEVK